MPEPKIKGKKHQLLQRFRHANTPRPNLSHPAFTANDFHWLAYNQYNRYAPNSHRIAHAILVHTPEGKTLALQYQLPSAFNAPTVCILNNIQPITRFNRIRYRATGPDGKHWYAKRYEHAQIKFSAADKLLDADLAYFSEGEGSDVELDWESHAATPRFAHPAPPLKNTHTKGGHALSIDPESVRWRAEHPRRKPSQGKVMGKSAVAAYESLFNALENKLSPEFSAIFKRAFTSAPHSQYRPEWLHAYGFSLTPCDKNPQRRNNLGAAGRWANTEMLVLEKMAQWFATHQHQTTSVSIKTLFDMLHHSDVIDKIHFEVNLQTKDRLVRFTQDLDAFQQSPVFRKASDSAQATGIAHAILTGEKPIRASQVTPPSPCIVKKPPSPAHTPVIASAAFEPIHDDLAFMTDTDDEDDFDFSLPNPPSPAYLAHSPLRFFNSQRPDIHAPHLPQDLEEEAHGAPMELNSKRDTR